MPLLADADKLAQQLTEEGLVDYVKALARLTATIAKNPQAAAMHLITELESLVKPKLNEWAAAGGEDEKVAAAGAGMLAFGVQTGAMMASSACDSAAVRRMVVSQEWLAQKLEMKSAANVSQQLRRFDGKSAIKKVPEDLKPFLEEADATNS